MEDKFLSSTKLLQWIESILTAALKEFEHDDAKVYIDLDLDNVKTRLFVSGLKAYMKIF